jgi:hypothetical protein
MVYFDLLLQHSPGESEENHESISVVLVMMRVPTVMWLELK